MADVATLGIQVDSASARTAAGDLDKLSSSAGKADQATQGLNSSSGESETRLRAMEAAAKRLGIPIGDYASKIASVSKAMNDNVASTGSFTAGLGKTLTSANAVSLVLQGITSAATLYFAYIASQTPTVEQTFAEQARLLGVIKSSYDRTTQAARYWIEQSKDVTRLQLLQQEIDLRQKLQAEIGKNIAGFTSTTFDSLRDFLNTALASEAFTSIDEFGEKVKTVKAELRPFQDAIFKLQEEFKQGSPNVRNFVDEVARLTLLDPTLQNTGAKVIKDITEASKLFFSLQQNADQKGLVNGQKLGDDARRRLGLADSGTQGPDPFASQVNSISKHIAAMQADADAVDATAGEHAKLRAQAQLLEAVQRQGYPATAAQTEAMKKLGQSASDAAMALAKAKVESEIRFGKSTALLSPEDVQIAQRLKEIYPDVATALNSVEAQAMRVNSAIAGVSSVMSSNMTTAISDVINGTKSAGDAFKDFSKVVIRAIEEAIVKLMIVGPLMRALSGFGGGGLLGLFGGAAAFGAASSTGAAGVGGIGGLYADGGAFDRSNVIPFSRGGIFNSPTLFRFANGGAMNAGVMGEAGPEAVMPLTRGANGKLGVQNHSGSGSSETQSVHVTVGVSVDDDGKIQAYVKNVSQQTTQDGIQRYTGSPLFHQGVVNSVVKARKGRGL